MDGAIGGEESEIYEQAGVAVFSSLNDLFAGIDRLAAYEEFRSARARERTREPRASVVRELPAVGGIVSDLAAKAVVADYGIEFPRERLVTNVDAAVAAAAEFGYPVVLKVVSDRIPHKTEAGGVELELRGAEEVRLAYERILANAERFLGDVEIDGVLVQEQVQRGIELIAGIKVDPTLGPFILVGIGGVLAELLKDVALRPAPVSQETAREMIAGLRASPVLHGYRGAPPADLEAAAGAVSALSRLAVDYSDSLRELDVNPLLVLPKGQGVRVADVLMVVEG
jgi:acetyltransferase